MQVNKTKEKLKNNQPVYGVISPTTDPSIAEYMGLLGFDFYMIDGEHGAITASDISNIIRACEIVGCTPLARIRSTDPKLILQFFDAGIMGVMMPSLKNVADVEALVKAVKYPGLGERGLGPTRASEYMLGKMNQLEYVNFANEQTLVLPQIEDIEAVNNLEAMCAVEGIDGFVIGPRDLAMSMGFYDGPNHDEVKQMIDKIIATVQKHHLIIGTVAATGEQAKTLTEKGVNFILNSVAGLLGAASKEFFAKVK
jgi:4-hydroxy-2-oxoheptanedioate aldolase